METKKLLKNLKHKFSGMLCLVMLLGFTTSMWADNVTFNSGDKLYYDLGAVSWWVMDNGEGNFIYFYGSSGNGWSSATTKIADKVYSVDAPAGTWDHIILTRSKNKTAGWDVWNQTGDIELKSGKNYLTNFAEGSSTATWSTYNPCTGPTVTTGNATSVTAHTASLPGTVSSTTDLTEVGIKMGDSYYQASSVASNFSFAATNLESGKQYTYQAYAKKSCGTFVGTEKTFTTTSVTYEFTVYFKANSGWTNPYIHMWPVGSDVAFVNNQQMTAVAGASGWYKYDVTTTNQKWKIILKNGSEWGTKSEDSGPFDSTDSEHCYIVSNSKVTATDCPVICTTPTATQYPMTNATVTYDGNSHAPTITPADDAGNVSKVYYAGVEGSGKTDAGTYAITVDVAAGSTYCAATGISLGNFVINKANQAELTLSSSASSACVAGGSITFSTTGGSGGGAVTYAITSGTGGSISGNTLTATQAGTFTVQATKAADNNYNEIKSNNSITVTFNAGPTAGSITASPESPICKGTSTTLIVAGFTDGSTLQWYKGSSELTGETTASYSTEVLSEAATYKVVVTKNGCTSETAPITINVQEPTLNVALTSAAGADKVYVWEAATFTPTTDGTITEKSVTRQSGSGSFFVEDGANDSKIVKAGGDGDVFRASFTTSKNGCTKTVTKDITVEKATEDCSK